MKTLVRLPATILMMSTALHAPAFAQVPPTRPGLVINQPTTELVQRQIDPLTGLPMESAPGPYGSTPGGPYPAGMPPAPPQDEFFFVEEGSAGPDNLAGGLSDYNTGRMNQAGQQLRGDYGNMSRSGMPSGMMQEAWSRPFDNMSAGQSAPGTIRYQWSADLVMPVRLRAGMNTSIVLPDWEAVEDVSIGDGSAIQASILRQNQILVKSVQVGKDTSLSIVGGSGNLYTFYLRTEGHNTALVTDLQVFVQAAPSEGSDDWFDSEIRSAFSSRQRSNADVIAGGIDDADITMPGSTNQGDEPVPIDKRIFNLKMYEVNKGDRIIAPEYVYTDGRFTYLHYAAGVTDRPAVFRVVDGVEGRVNTRVVGRHSEIIVVEALGDLILRSGTRAVCIMEVDSDGKVLAAARRR